MMSPVANRDPEADGPKTSGMVALVPSQADRARLAVDGGEDPDQLHLTLAYLGDNATDMDPDTRAALHDSLRTLAASTPPVAARVAGHLTFNPDGGPDGDRAPCAVYLVSDSPALAPIQSSAAAAVPDIDQHAPWIPHITGVYDRDAGALHYAGPVTFPTLRVAIGQDVTDLPLTGGLPQDGQDAQDTDGDTPAKESKSMEDDQAVISLADLATAFEFKAEDTTTNCLPDGSYQINHPGQLKTAVNALTSGAVSGGKRAALRKHVLHHAKRLHATNMVPPSVAEEKDEEADKTKGGKENKGAGPAREVKKVVATQAGANHYHKPIGTQLGPARDENAAKAQLNKDAVGAYKNLLAGNTAAVAPLGKMDTSSLEDLTRVAYSYKSKDPKVVALRISLANELAHRGLKVTDFGALGEHSSAHAKRMAHHAKKTVAKKTPAQQMAAMGVAAPHQQVKSLDVEELEFKSKYTAEQARVLAKKGHALPDGSYPIADKSDLKSAIALRNNGKGYTKATIHKHIVKRAKALDAADMLPPDMDGAESKALSWDGAPDAFTAGVLLGLSGLDTEHALELKAGPPGHTFPSPDPRAKKLRDYWVHGPGAVKIAWGTPHDFDRCVVELTKYVGARAKGLCNIYHRSALGVAPGQEDKPGKIAAAVGKAVGAATKGIAAPGDIEVKTPVQLWLRDTASVDGWRAYAPAWEIDPGLVAEMKAFTPAPTDEQDDEQPNTDQDTGGDDVMSSLDKYAAMVPRLSEEQAYEQAIGDDIPWQLQGSGDLVDPNNPDGGSPEVLQDDVPEGGAEQAPVDAVLFEDDDLDGDAGQDDGTQDPDVGGDNPDGDTPDDGDPEPGAIPAVAELLAALLDAETGPNAANDDADNGQAEEDGDDTTPPKPAAPAKKSAPAHV